MKLRLSLRNSARAAHNSLIAALIFLILGCSAAPGPSYTIKNLSASLSEICKNEYNIPVVTRLQGQTLWVYIPLEEELFIETGKLEEYSKKFEVKSIDSSLSGGSRSEE